MADTNPISFDPNHPYTPEQFAEVERLKLEGGYNPFDFSMGKYTDQATSELKPYYTNLFNQLGVLEKGQIDQSAKTYEDLVKNLQESYNQRGRFFGGQAIKAEGDLAGEQAQRLAEIQAGFGTRRADATLEMSNKSLERAAQLQQQAYDQYKATKAADISRTVSARLAEYIPGYADAIKKQMADENNPWLEIPLEAGVDYANPTTTAAKTTTLPEGAAYRIPNPKYLSDFSGNELVRSNGGIFLSKAAHAARYVGPSSLKKYKKSELVKVGNDYFLKKGVKKR